MGASPSQGMGALGVPSNVPAGEDGVRAVQAAKTAPPAKKKKQPKRKQSWLKKAAGAVGKVAGKVAKNTVKSYTGIKL